MLLLLTSLSLVACSSDISTTIPRIKLHNTANADSFIPSIGLGTAWNNDSNVYQTGFDSATKWLSIGGRLFDSAHCYPARNGIADGVLNYTNNYKSISRSEIFITSKVGGCAGNNLGYNEVKNWFNNILLIWNTSYIDLILLHWPSYDYFPGNYNQQTNDESCMVYYNGTFGPYYNATQCRLKSWKALIELYLNGKIKAIGVSNFEEKHLNDIFNYKYDDNKYYLPALNQMQFHGYRHEYDSLDFCKKYNIQYNSWATLGAPDVQQNVWNGSTPVLTQHPIAIDIGKKYNKSAAQIWLRWQRQLDVIPIPRSNDIEHMMENINIFDFELDNGDMDKLYNITAPPYYSNLVYTHTPMQDPNNLP